MAIQTKLRPKVEKVDLTNLQRGPVEKAKQCFWRTTKGSLTPITYWECIDPGNESGEVLILVEFSFVDAITGEPGTSLRLYPADHPNFVLISDLQFV